MSERVVVELPDDLVERVAARAAAIVLAELEAGRAAAAVSPWMTVREAAEYLGSKRQRVDDLLSQGRLSRFKEGARTLVSRAELEALVVQERVGRVASSLPTARQDGSGSGLP